MISSTPLPQNVDVRQIRMWLNDATSRIRRLEAKLSQADARQNAAANSSSIAPMIAKVTTASPLTVDIYRGEGANEKKIHEGVTDVQLNSDYTATVNQRLLAIKIRGTWELYMIVDGVSENFAADVFQVLGTDGENKLCWNTPAIDLYLDSANNDALTVKLTLGDSEYTASIGTCPPVEES